MDEHTPTPWREWNVMAEAGKDEYPEPHAGDIRLVGSNNICIGVAFGGYASLPECAVNAAFIVRAVNNHDALVKALQAVADFMRKDVQSGDSDLWTPEYEDLHDDVIVALNGAVGGPSNALD